MPGHVRTFHFLQRGEAGSGRQPNRRGVEPGKPSAPRKFLHFLFVFCRDLGTGRLILSYSFEMLVLTSPLQNDFSRWPEPSVLLRGGDKRRRGARVGAGLLPLAQRSGTLHSMARSILAICPGTRRPPLEPGTGVLFPPQACGWFGPTGSRAGLGAGPAERASPRPGVAR